MVSLKIHIALLAGALGTATAAVGAPIAMSQPPLAPICASGETPYNHTCRTACQGGAPLVGGACTQPGTVLNDRGMNEETHPGANPRTPLGTNPHVPFGTNTTTVLQ